MAKMSFNRNYDINRVVRKLVYTILALYVGGTIITTFGDVMNGTCSPFYTGLTLIGWTVGTTTQSSTASCIGNANTITATSGTGVLAVVGIIGIAGVVLEFVSFR